MKLSKTICTAAYVYRCGYEWGLSCHCPSIEDKIVRFGGQGTSPTLPWARRTHKEEVYVQGLSTSLPEDVQRASSFYQSIGKCRWCNCVMLPIWIWSTSSTAQRLRSKKISGLFTAGQTTERVRLRRSCWTRDHSGINAALKIHGNLSWFRNEADVIGVMILDGR